MSCDGHIDPDLCALINRSFPGSETIGIEQTAIDATITDNDKIRIINRRSNHLIAKLNPTLARGEADFISFTVLSQFFEQAARRGAAVCQILKKCSNSDVDSFTAALESNHYTLEQLRDILYDADPGDAFWQRFSIPATSDDIKRLSNTLKEKIKEQGFYVPMGTGFLVGRDHLMTNNHVLPKVEEATDYIARFRYDRHIDLEDGNLQFSPVNYALDADFFVSSPPNQLDYTLVKVKRKKVDIKRGLSFPSAGDNFGWLPLFENDDLISPPANKEMFNQEVRTDGASTNNKVNKALETVASLFGLPGEPVNIIQHPRGRAKEIVFHSNRVQKISPKYIQYEADTDLGSSGSPVLNRQWQAVALHHAVLVEETAPDEMNIQGSVGIRTCKIVEDLKIHKSLEQTNELQEFIDEFVIPQDGLDQNRVRGTVYILAEIFMESHIVEPDLAGKFDALPDTIKSIAQRIQNDVSVSNVGYRVELIPIQKDRAQSDGEVVDDWLKARELSDATFSVGDIALFITMDAYYSEENKPGAVKRVTENDSLRGIGVYYSGNRRERQAQAQLFSQILLSQGVKPMDAGKGQENAVASKSIHRRILSLILPNRGVRSDLTFIREPGDPPGKESSDAVKDAYYRSLPFTRSLGIPSLMLRLGFVTNPEDRMQVVEHEVEIAEGIVKGLLAWADSINPVTKEAYRSSQIERPEPTSDRLSRSISLNESPPQSQEMLLQPEDTLYRLLL